MEVAPHYKLPTLLTILAQLRGLGMGHETWIISKPHFCIASKALKPWRAYSFSYTCTEYTLWSVRNEWSDEQLKLARMRWRYNTIYIYIFHRRLTVRFLFNPMSHERRNWRRFWTENPEIASTYLVGKSVEVGCRECKTVFNVVRVARSWVCNLLCLAGRGLFWGERQHSSDLTKWEKRLMAYQCVGMSSTSSTS